MRFGLVIVWSWDFESLIEEVYDFILEMFIIDVDKENSGRDTLSSTELSQTSVVPLNFQLSMHWISKEYVCSKNSCFLAFD